MSGCATRGSLCYEVYPSFESLQRHKVSENYSKLIFNYLCCPLTGTGKPWAAWSSPSWTPSPPSSPCSSSSFSSSSSSPSSACRCHLFLVNFFHACDFFSSSSVANSVRRLPAPLLTTSSKLASLSSRFRKSQYKRILFYNLR